MSIFITFLEGIITFISPCMLPMLPMYISYFAGGNSEDKKTAIKNSFGFVIGFSLIFILLGGVAGKLGNFFIDNKRIVSVVSGLILIIFGLHYTDILSIKILDRVLKINYQPKEAGGFLSSLVFGVIFSIGWTPCVGVFLGSALAVAANSASALEGVVLLLAFSLGLGIPFIITAGLIGQLKSVFDSIKKHYRTINILSGMFLIITGILMISGVLERILSFLSRRF